MVSDRSDRGQAPRLDFDIERCRWRRVAAGLAQQELAKLAGINKCTMCLAEQGKRNLSPPVLARVAQALGCQITDLMPPEAVAGVTQIEPARHSPDAAG